MNFEHVFAFLQVSGPEKFVFMLLSMTGAVLTKADAIAEILEATLDAYFRSGKTTWFICCVSNHMFQFYVKPRVLNLVLCHVVLFSNLNYFDMRKKPNIRQITLACYSFWSKSLILLHISDVIFREDTLAEASADSNTDEDDVDSPRRSVQR